MRVALAEESVGNESDLRLAFEIHSMVEEVRSWPKASRPPP